MEEMLPNSWNSCIFLKSIMIPWSISGIREIIKQCFKELLNSLRAALIYLMSWKSSSAACGNVSSGVAQRQNFRGIAELPTRNLPREIPHANSF